MQLGDSLTPDLRYYHVIMTLGLCDPRLFGKDVRSMLSVMMRVWSPMSYARKVLKIVSSTLRNPLSDILDNYHRSFLEIRLKSGLRMDTQCSKRH